MSRIGTITEVFIDAVAEKQTGIKITVTNTGAASTAYFIKLTDCSAKLSTPVFPESDGDNVLVPPQYPHTYTIILPGNLPKKNAHCTGILFL